MKILRQFALIGVICLLLMGCEERAPQAQAGRPGTADKTVAGSYPEMGVRAFDKYLVENKGTPTMLLFWTTWCPSCKEELPELEALKASHGDKINIITVSLDEDVAALDTYFAKNNFDLPVYLGNKSIARKFRVASIPMLLVFDGDGNKIFDRAGVFPHSMLVKVVDRLTSR